MVKEYFKIRLELMRCQSIAEMKSMLINLKNQNIEIEKLIKTTVYRMLVLEQKNIKGYCKILELVETATQYEEPHKITDQEKSPIKGKVRFPYPLKSRGITKYSIMNIKRPYRGGRFSPK